MNTEFGAQFKKTKLGTQPSVAPLIDLWKIERATGTKTTVVLGGATSYAGRGIYYYHLINSDSVNYVYVGAFYTTDTTVDDQEPPVWQQDWSDTLAKDTAGKVLNVGTVDTLTGHTPQSGDTFTRIGADGAGLTALATQSSVNTLSTTANSINAKTTNLPAAPAAVGSAMTLTTGERTSIGTAVWATTTRTLSNFGTLAADVWAVATRRLSNLDDTRAAKIDNLDEAVSAPKTLTTGARDAVAAAIETELANDSTGGAFMQAIMDKLTATFDIEELSIAAIRDAILNRVVSGNHEVAGSVGKLLQNADVAVSTRNAIAPATPANVTAARDAVIAAIPTDYQQRNVAVTLPTVDGIPLTTSLEQILAMASGDLDSVDNEDGTYTLTFKKRDGVTTAFSVNYNPTTGARL